MRVAVSGFDAAPDCTAFRLPVLGGEKAELAGVGAGPAITVPVRAGAAETDKVELVLIEEDGSPWGATLPLKPEWTVLTLRPGDLRFFEHWQHPDGRGGPGDVVHVDRIAAVNVCFGSWLYGDQYATPHAVEIGDIGVSRGP